MKDPWTRVDSILAVLVVGLAIVTFCVVAAANSGYYPRALLP